jgi:uncharacterized protein (TIGR04255 family)
MALQHHERVQFRRNPLKLVIAQVQFPLLPRIGDQSYVASFLEAFTGEYPRTNREQQVSLQITTSGVSQEQGDPQWRLSTIDQLRSIVLSSNAMTLEVREYISIDELIQRFQRMLAVGTKSLPITERLRLGLRFINEIRLPEAESLSQWQEYLQPGFLGFAASEAFQGEGRVSQTLQQVQIERSDGTLIVKHGLLTGTVVPPLPGTQPDMGPFYMIDLDYYDAQPGELDVASAVTQVRRYNDVLYDIFRWALTPALYQKLEPMNAG